MGESLPLICSNTNAILLSPTVVNGAIAPKHIPVIFHRFWRANEARKYREEGLELELTIASAIAQRHAGAIAVTSQVGVGSCFEVRLPIAS